MHSIIAVLAFILAVIAGLPTDETVISTVSTVSSAADETTESRKFDESVELETPSNNQLIEQISGYPRFAQTRIVGGSGTSIGVYPSMVAVLRASSGSILNFHCGGTIINLRTIVTAAHCVYGDVASKFRFRVGSTNAMSGGRVIPVAQIRVHTNYRPPSYNADIALLRGSTPIVFDTRVKAARYASSGYRLNPGMSVRAVGWGATRWGGASVDSLRHVQLRVSNHDTCRRNYAKRNLIVNNNMICAGWPKGGRDQCQGDSGGPLFHNGLLVGISSFGHQCALADFPGVNTKVSVFNNWIARNTFWS